MCVLLLVRAEAMHARSVKRIERSDGLGVALYKKYRLNREYHNVNNDVQLFG